MLIVFCSSPRAGNGADTNNRDEYDVLGRKKSVPPGLDFSRDTCLQFLIIRPKTPRTPMSWDPKDDILLKRLKEEQRLGWKEIATHCESCINISARLFAN
jgi:hypothetical protein